MEYNEQLTNLKQTLMDDILDRFEWGQDKVSIEYALNERITDFLNYEEVEEETDYYIEYLKADLKDFIYRA